MDKLYCVLDGRRATLTQAFRVRIYQTYDDFAVTAITVPQGFTTDFASVPRAFWRIIPPWGEYNRAAVVHDFLYQQHRYNRKVADRIFLELMTRLGVSWWKRRAMYSAVRSFGWVAWRNAKQS